MNEAEQLIFGDNVAPHLEFVTDDRVSVEQTLHSLLADTYRLLANTAGLRWNVEGALFNAVRAIAEEHRRELFDATEDIAERLRALGHPVPQAFDDLPAMSALDDVEAQAAIEVQIEQLAEGHDRLADRLRVFLAKHKTAVSDPKTTAMLTERIGAHERYAWMLRAVAK